MKPFSRRTFLSGSVLAALYGIAHPGLAFAKPSSGTIAWRNWSGGQIAHPAGRFSPTSEQALANFFATTSGSVRPVGSGHSFTGLVPTDGHL
ncbi:MAG: hypothetical protein ACI8VR_001316, partial [Candidatus Azotimanducaceae bacterium]